MKLLRGIPSAFPYVLQCTGPEYFGLCSPHIVEAIEALDEERQCKEYWQGHLQREQLSSGINDVSFTITIEKTQYWLAVAGPHIKRHKSDIVFKDEISAVVSAEACKKTKKNCNVEPTVATDCVKQSDNSSAKPGEECSGPELKPRMKLHAGVCAPSQSQPLRLEENVGECVAQNVNHDVSPSVERAVQQTLTEDVGQASPSIAPSANPSVAKQKKANSKRSLRQPAKSRDIEHISDELSSDEMSLRFSDTDHDIDAADSGSVDYEDYNTVSNAWSALSRAERYRRRCKRVAESEDNQDVATPPPSTSENLPRFFDAITLSAAEEPAVSLADHVLGYKVL